MSHEIFSELARIRHQELQDEAANNRMVHACLLGRERRHHPNLDHVLGALRSLLALLTA